MGYCSARGDEARDLTHHYESSYDWGIARSGRGGELIRLAQLVVGEMVAADEPVPPHLAADLQAATYRCASLPSTPTTPHTAGLKLGVVYGLDWTVSPFNRWTFFS
ncbi:unnamed protein product [Vitrella brassicaformis CCMP3155]|uniref:Uncharacterized protein n=1 Tax=Vitrella brassicaformis (strain CCMP3155) TaxID=1169540 RepID=A0A0G4EHN1_VITBC|nr:unnamed protein product [Vitrella brassicaformis CCMP3155]|eukprot:CEL95525.1 unnamed protein product [Vitrella brassicaformis CCMP3155]